MTYDPALSPIVEAAAKLAKTDLTSELVKEFTELQGIIGGVYARAQGLDQRVADAIYWQYRPANTEDQIPPTVEGQILGLADRIQTIVSMFSIGNAPTGSKDPFALRRAANAVIKIIAKSELPFDIGRLIRSAVDGNAMIEQEVRVFFNERLQFYLKDVHGFAYDVANAVLAECTDVARDLDVHGAIAIASAITQIRNSENFRIICQTFKRIKNILRQAEEKQFLVGPPNVDHLGLEAKLLSDSLAALIPEVIRLRQHRAYGEALAAIATLGPVVDAFFNKVMVLDPDSAVARRASGLDREASCGASVALPTSARS